MNTGFDLKIAEIGVRFRAEFSMEIPSTFRPFTATLTEADEDFTILSAVHSIPTEPPVARLFGHHVYRMDDGWLRVFPSGTAPDGSIPATYLRNSGHHTVYLPPSDLKRYQSNCSFTGLIAGEYLFSRHAAVLLHSSAVLWEEKLVLFSGVSGAGKSTQADLWRKHLDADVINGDRCVLRKIGGELRGYGSPFCGSSAIYRPEGGKIAAIFLPEKASVNETKRLSPAEAFQRLYSNLTVNRWDVNFVSCALEVLTCTVETVPVFLLRCRPDAEAVAVAKQALS